MEAAQANPPTGVPSYANASSFDGAAAYGDIGFVPISSINGGDWLP